MVSPSYRLVPVIASRESLVLIRERCTLGPEVVLTVMFIPLNNWEQFETSLLRGEVGCVELFRKRCSSNIDAVGRSAGFLWKHNLRKSLPSGDIDSGTGGLSLMTLNIAAAY